MNDALETAFGRRLWISALLLLALAAMPVTAGAAWYDNAPGRHPGFGSLPTLDVPRPPPAPRAPLEERRFLMDTPSYLSTLPPDVHPIPQFAFPGLHQGGIFDYRTLSRITTSPSPHILSGREGYVDVVPETRSLESNAALYGNGASNLSARSLWGNSPGLGGLSPHVLSIERR